jgi:hypothetical protein
VHCFLCGRANGSPIFLHHEFYRIPDSFMFI